METATSIPQPARQTIEQIGGADLLVGVLADLDQDGLAAICRDLRTLSGSPRILVLHRAGVGPEGAPESSAASEGEAALTLMPWSQFKLDEPGTVVQSMANAYESVYAASEKLGVRACCVISSKLEPAQPKWVCQFVSPILDNKFDFVLPRYAHRQFDGLLNSAMISPLARCLYGKRFQNPMGPDVALSRALTQKMLGGSQNSHLVARQLHPLASLTSMAICNGLRGCQVHIGTRTYPPPDWTNVSSLISQALGPVFLDIERNAACWQRTRWSAPVPSFGGAPVLPKETGSVDIARLVGSFQLGARDLQEIWSAFLPPATLLEIVKLARLPAEQFHMPDELWVRIVYDFALAHRLRTINRDHLLGSLTPLFLGWVASFAHELENAGNAAAEPRLERLAAAYEADKSYLVSRWRWPDRFNP